MARLRTSLKPIRATGDNPSTGVSHRACISIATSRIMLASSLATFVSTVIEISSSASIRPLSRSIAADIMDLPYLIDWQGD